MPLGVTVVGAVLAAVLIDRVLEEFGLDINTVGGRIGKWLNEA